MSDLGRGDRAITPSDEVVKVLFVEDGEAQLRYVEALDPAIAIFYMRVSLLAKWDYGRPRPRPIRRAFA